MLRRHLRKIIRFLSQELDGTEKIVGENVGLEELESMTAAYYDQKEAGVAKEDEAKGEKHGNE